MISVATAARGPDIGYGEPGQEPVFSTSTGSRIVSSTLSHPLTNPVHRFHIPVMGTGFTIDTPLKVARYGISSVVSLVDDVLIEQMRRRLASEAGADSTPIEDADDDARARRITAYLDLLHDLVQDQMERLRTAAFTAGSEINRYFEMLPDSPLRSLYETMQQAADPAERARLQAELRARVVPGGIDVNIMTKLDRMRLQRGQALGPLFSDALSALRGYANSKVCSSVVLSAGLNRRLFGYLREFTDFLPDDAGDLKKRIILKVSDFRSAVIQGKLLARDGLWVSEYRVESGLNCGGHAFGGAGTLLGPILAEFARERENLAAQLYGVWRGSLERLGRAGARRAAAGAGDGPGRHRHRRGDRPAAGALRPGRHRLGQPVPDGARGREHRRREPGPPAGRRRGRRAPEPGLAPGRALLVPARLVQRDRAPRAHRPRHAGQRLPQGLPGGQHRIHQGAHLHRQPRLPAPRPGGIGGRRASRRGAGRPPGGHHRQGLHLPRPGGQRDGAPGHRSRRHHGRLLRSQLGLLRPDRGAARDGRPHLRPGAPAPGRRPSPHVPQGAVAAPGPGARGAGAPPRAAWAPTAAAWPTSAPTWPRASPTTGSWRGSWCGTSGTISRRGWRSCATTWSRCCPRPPVPRRRAWPGPRRSSRASAPHPPATPRSGGSPARCCSCAG